MKMKMKMKTKLIAPLLGALIVLAGGCTEAPQTATETPLPPEGGVVDVPTDEPITLAPQTVAAGSDSLSLAVAFPEGWHINTDAPPFEATWEPDGTVIQIDEGDRAMQLVDPSFPVQVPVTLAAGEADLKIHLRVFYCDDNQIICTMERRTLIQPLTVSEDAGEAAVTMAYTVVPPELPE